MQKLCDILAFGGYIIMEKPIVLVIMDGVGKGQFVPAAAEALQTTVHDNQYNGFFHNNVTSKSEYVA